jgi:hypothetical protein
MRFTVKQLRETIRGTINEAQGALKMLDVIQLRLILAKEKKVEEILTGVRIIKGVATVSQVEPMIRLPNGTRSLDILVTFDPGEMETLEYIDTMARVAKKIPDVSTIIIKTLNDQPIRNATGKRKLVY